MEAARLRAESTALDGALDNATVLRRGLVHDGVCSGCYGTVYTHGSAHGHNLLTLPTKDTWGLTGLRPPHRGDLNIVHLRLGSRGQTPICIVYHEGVKNIGGSVHMKRFQGKHRGLDEHSTCIMRQLHKKYYCKDGGLELRTEPPNKSSCGYLG